MQRLDEAKAPLVIPCFYSAIDSHDVCMSYNVRLQRTAKAQLLTVRCTQWLEFKPTVNSCMGLVPNELSIAIVFRNRINVFFRYAAYDRSQGMNIRDRPLKLV